LFSQRKKAVKVLEKKIQPRWYALYTRSRAEKKVYEQLKSLGINTYLPLRRELRQWSDRKKWVEVPVISSYIFVNITPSQYRDVFNAHGVVAYVSHKGKAVPIPDHEIEAMRRTVENKLAFSVESDTLRKGEKVTITSGPLKGIEGEVEEIKGRKKLYLRISHIGYMLVLNLEDVVRKEEG
jgi:transcription antitermination factor NusG